jgi:hypothetical protein
MVNGIKTGPGINSCFYKHNFQCHECHLLAPKLDHRACSFCKKAKHFVGQCPTLHQHNVAPLARSNLKSRTQLQADLPSGGRIVTLSWDTMDNRTVYQSLPAGVGAIFILKWFYVNSLNQNEHEYGDNYCVECTLLKVGGEQHGEYTCSVFLVSCVATHVVKSQSNWIISMLQYTNQRPIPRLSQIKDDPPSQIQPSQIQCQLPQLFQLSQKSLTHDPRPPGFWINPTQGVLGQMLAQVSNLMLSQASQLQGPGQQMGFDFSGAHL